MEEVGEAMNRVSKWNTTHSHTSDYHEPRIENPINRMLCVSVWVGE